MVSIARKNLFHDRGRLIISVGGVAFATMLILTLTGVYYGVIEMSTGYLRETNADLWVGQEGIHDTWHTYSLLPRGLEDEILSVGGVKEVYGFVGRAVRAEISQISDEEKTVFVVGFDTSSGVGGPWKIIKGKKIPRSGQVIVDRVFSVRNGIEIGDRLTVGGKELTVVGISDGTFLLVYSYIFVTEEDAMEIFGAKGFLNYYMVEVEDPIFSKKIAKNIEDRLEKTGIKVDVLTREEFIDNHKEVINDSFNSILLPLVFIGFFIGVTVIGLTLYTATLEKIREYAILKAIGARGTFMVKIVFEQSFIIGLLGFGVGLGLSIFASGWIPNIAPEFAVVINLNTIMLTFLSLLGMSAVASLIPIRKLEKVDPATVFQA
jgi:putative ABC transport system permease protein